VLDRRARVDSVCATTGEPVSIVVGPEGVEHASPLGVVISFLRQAGRFDHDVILSFCHHVRFFSSEAAGQEWLAGREDAQRGPTSTKLDEAHLVKLS
jgi:hypothetical protein